MGEKPKIIKRYQNRKLYDTEQSCYVTLEDLAGMIRRGEELQVLDNKTQEDITATTLTQIIFETEKKSNKVIPLHLLQDIIKGSGGSISHFFQEKIKPSIEKTVKTSAKELVQVGHEIQRKFEEVTGKSHLHQEINRLRQKIQDLEKKIKSLTESDPD